MNISEDEPCASISFFRAAARHELGRSELFVLKIDRLGGYRHLEDSRDKWTLRRNRIDSPALLRDLMYTKNLYVSMRDKHCISSYGEKIARAIPTRVRISLRSYESS